MGWTAPTDRSTGYTVTAADWNIVEDNLTFLGNLGGALVDTSESTASLSYTDLTTPGPSVTVTTGGHALVIISAQISNNTGADGAAMSFAISGATTLAASDTNCIFSSLGTSQIKIGSVAVVATTAGSNVFTAKYRAVTGGTASFAHRYIAVIPIP